MLYTFCKIFFIKLKSINQKVMEAVLAQVNLMMKNLIPIRLNPTKLKRNLNILIPLNPNLQLEKVIIKAFQI